MMMRMLKRLLRLRDDQGGAALFYIAISLPALFAFTSIAVDMGYVWYMKTRLQIAADMGALAGASKLYTADATTVTDLASTYVNYNLPSATSTPQVMCLDTIKTMGLTCQSLSGGNALKVTVSATVPLFFARAFGKKTIGLTANAMVTGGGAVPPPMNVAIILDATASMSTSLGTACGSLGSPKKIECATLAAKTLMAKLWGSIDQVALYTYPAFDANSKDVISCKAGASGTPAWNTYQASGSTNYQLAAFSDNYIASGTPPSGGLITTSGLVMALGKNPTTATPSDATTCNGLNTAVNSVVGTSFADAIAQAQRDLVQANLDLVARGQPVRQNVMIVLSDGDANGNSMSILGPSGSDPFITGTDIYGVNTVNDWMTNKIYKWVNDVPTMMDQCDAAVKAADAATAAGTWVYAVAFGSPYAAKGSCFTDRKVTSVTKTATTTPALTSADKIVAPARACTSSNPCKNIAAKANTITSTIFPVVTSGSSTTQVAATGWGGTIETKCTRSNGNPAADGNTSSGSTCVTTLSNATKIQTDTYDLKTYDTTACATMRAIASDDSKFYSTDGNTGCASAANPNFTDLVKIFNNVAASIMKKRRIPNSTT